MLFNNTFAQKSRINKDGDDFVEINSKSEAVKMDVEKCIENVAEESIFTLGRYGGQTELVGNYFDNEIFDANYLYYLGEKKVATISEMESSLELLMEEHLGNCVGSFNKEINTINLGPEKVNKNLLFDIFVEEKGEVQADVQISEGFVTYNVKWPLLVNLNSQEKEIVNYPEKEFLVNLNHMALFSEEFIKRIHLNPYILDANYIMEQNYTADIAMMNNDTYVFLITDNSSMIDYQPLKFLMAAKINTSQLYLLGD